MSMLIVRKAGAVVLSKSDPSLVALIFRAGHGDWSFPKGHVEEGETSVRAMAREVAEETGLSVHSVGVPLPAMEYDHPSGSHVILDMFLAQSEDDTALRTEFNGDRVVWVDYAEVADRLSHENVRQYYSGVQARIKTTIDGLRVVEP
ncbi:hypothetical protein COY93_04460 [Candidatus Uhrbacteria bacterium CG_4_10_14_0_8_um_filter_58_22]|uniref:Nudix hydrolase domain-containing protein n=1 Tax=Candidatus Uhrbacteria bacterium CG_4_10_14_0_8_um_filter_58_22 TaxID=1975029 RepID=A0A2M7Q9Z4_9BACT|nr:MAG: hypothetical protein COY93_04460 [Candidatus Uhrbacteria bacterium CG_4_10_14_0_8_um_filter_58_22]